MPPSRSDILDFPFFTLEYRDGLFARLIPADAKDLGGGLFRQGGKTWRLPDGGEAAPLAAPLAAPFISGRPLLALLNRGPGGLIKKGPRLALPDERLMELGFAGAGPEPGAAGPGPLTLELRCFNKTKEWLPLDGLPHHRLCCEVIYEIIDEAILRDFTEARSGSRYVLKGENIPRFADTQGRLIFRFGDQKLKEAFAEDSVFVKPGQLALVLGALRENDRKTGRAWALPILRYDTRAFLAGEVSLRMDREFILLEDQWVRREDILALGVFPLGCYAGGAGIEKIKLKPGELLRRGSERFAGLFSDLELLNAAGPPAQAEREKVFHEHLEFLRSWGISGGVVFNGHREQAALLCAALLRLAAVGAGTLALMEKRYYDLYLSPLLPELKAGAIALPETGRKQEDSPVRIAFYEDLPLSPPDARKAADILLLVEPEEAIAHEKTLAALQKLKPALTLGIFSSAWELFRSQAAAKARSLFRITEAELTPCLIRDTAKGFNLPRFEFPPPAILRPSMFSPEQRPCRFTVEEKFSGLSGPSLYSELALYKTSGQDAPFIPLRLLKGNLDIERMEPEELAFFLFWRTEFRRGNIIKTGEAYIRIYARELCLFTGEEAELSGSFRELLKLWESYREIFESLNGFLPRWLVDFAVVYDIADNAFPLLIPRAIKSKDPLLADIYIHQRFIRENNSIEFADIELLIPKVFEEPAALTRDRRLVRNFEAVINAVDRCLREEFRLKLFEFFYPPKYDTEKREAFSGMERAGCSSYSIEGIRFTRHPPLLAFLENLFRYTEYCFKLKNGLELKGRAPPLEETWKRMADKALGIADNALIPSAMRQPVPLAPLNRTALPNPPPVPLRQIRLLDSRLEKLRDDSDAVRDLLKIEEDEEVMKNPRPVSPEIPRLLPSGAAKKKAPVKTFLKTLDRIEREALAVIAGADNVLPGLEAFARKHHTMPELLIDKINAAFLEQAGDLLVDTVDEEPHIQSEYTKEVQKLLGGK
jgi:hypothetical protein